jgi:predicted MPP superfamily phosphohydrolase
MAVPILGGLDAIDDGVRDGFSCFRACLSIQPQAAFSSTMVGASSLQTGSKEPTVLLAHSTDGFMTAAAAGVGLMLSGHTHGGQICLPRAIPVLTSSRMPRSLARGRWRQGVMHGYTSRGIGTTIVDVRFNCPPEATLHALVPTQRALAARTSLTSGDPIK